jgi:hypothetical protein
MTLEQIVTETRRLPCEQINALFDLLLAESFAQPDADVARAWRTETRWRIAEMESGAVQGVSGRQVMAELREITKP